MNAFCPFFKENCRGNECVMFENGECLVVSFLQTMKSMSEGGSPSEEATETDMPIYGRLEAEVPEWIKTRTPEELAAEMLEFGRKEFSEGVHFHRIASLFWKYKGLETYNMPSDVELKMEKANILAHREITKEAEVKEREQIEKEREELPSLIGQCVDWARVNRLKRLTLADVDTFLMEKRIEIHKKTRRALYAMANVRLKSSK